MTDALVQAKGYASGATASDLKALPDGALVVGDWLDAMIARGFGWHTTVGAFSTGIVGGGAGTVMLATDPELVIEVPLGQTMVPLRIGVQLELPLTNADDDESEILITVDRTQVGGSVAADGTVEIPLNMRTDIGSGCPCDVLSALTGAAAITPTRSFDLAHRTSVVDVQGSSTSTLWTESHLLYEPKHPIYIVGPATLAVYWGGTVATSGFAQAEFLSIPSSLVTELV